MPRVKYQGPHDAVDVVGVGTVKRGQAVNVPASVAKSLAEQADWKTVAPPKPPAKKTTSKSGAAGQNSEE